MILSVHKLRKCTRARVSDFSPQRWGTTSTSAHPSKAAGDISSVFPSLSGIDSPPLHPRFVDLKRRLILGHEDRVRDSWHRLLADLRKEIDVIKASGSKVIPELDFRDMHDMGKRTKFRDSLRKRGIGLIRGVVSEREALGWKELLKRYIQTNPSTKGRQPSRLFHDGAAASVFVCFEIPAKERGLTFEGLALRLVICSRLHVQVRALALVP